MKREELREAEAPPSQIAELTLQIRNLAHRGWEDRPNTEYLFREIGKRAQQIADIVAEVEHPEPAKEPLLCPNCSQPLIEHGVDRLSACMKEYAVRENAGRRF